MYKFMMLSPQDVHVPVAEWEKKRNENKTATKAGRMRNVAPGTQGPLKYQKSFSETSLFPPLSSGDQALSSTIKRRAKRLKGHLENVEDYEGVSRWDNAKAGNKKYGEVAKKMMNQSYRFGKYELTPEQVSGKIANRKEERDFRQHAGGWGVGYKEGLRYHAAYNKDPEKRAAAQRIINSGKHSAARGAIYGALSGGVAGGIGGGIYDKNTGKGYQKKTLGHVLAGAAIGALGGGVAGGAVGDTYGKMKQGRKEEHKFMDYEMEEFINYAIMLGEVVQSEGVESAAAIAEKPPGHIRRAYNWAKNTAHGAASTIRKAYEAKLTPDSLISKGKTLVHDVRSRLVKQRPGSETLVPIQHIPADQ